jgi:hypothetical protein
MNDDFIGIYDAALTPAQCAHILERFEGSDKHARGRTGVGVDVAKKDSWDITISQYKEWHDVPRGGSVLVALSRCVRLVGTGCPPYGALSRCVHLVRRPIYVGWAPCAHRTQALRCC